MRATLPATIRRRPRRYSVEMRDDRSGPQCVDGWSGLDGGGPVIVQHLAQSSLSQWCREREWPIRASVARPLLALQKRRSRGGRLELQPLKDALTRTRRRGVVVDAGDVPRAAAHGEVVVAVNADHAADASLLLDEAALVPAHEQMPILLLTKTWQTGPVQKVRISARCLPVWQRCLPAGATGANKLALPPSLTHRLTDVNVLSSRQCNHQARQLSLSHSLHTRANEPAHLLVVSAGLLAHKAGARAKKRAGARGSKDRPRPACHWRMHNHLEVVSLLCSTGEAEGERVHVYFRRRRAVDAPSPDSGRSECLHRLALSPWAR